MVAAMQKHSELRTRTHAAFLTQADAMRPALYRQRVMPISVVTMIPDALTLHGWRSEARFTPEQLSQQTFASGDEFIVDFGQHCVGYLSLRCESAGSPPDAPAHLQFIFGEISAEVAEPFSQYDGWLSRSWLQQEDSYLDVLPVEMTLPRRYCCRYVKVRVVSTSPKYGLRFPTFHLDTVSSASDSTLQQVQIADPLLREIDEISVRTLKNCMQDVFEDGPKRDRRLWLGDLRLQALVNYPTYAHNDLVKRCLYLFAGVTREDGMVSSNLFMQPQVIADDTFLFDYALLFVATLEDYVAATGDRATLDDLWPTARRQIELSLQRLDDRHILRDSEDWWAFIDWHEQLNKQAAAQGVLIYALRKGIQLARRCDNANIAWLETTLERVSQAALTHLWDDEQGFFVSGEARQVSWAAQVWLILGEVGDVAFRRQLLARLQRHPPVIKMHTPYMMHHFIEALLTHGEREQAVVEIKRYWGGMVQAGAETFWELYDPDNPDYSPYGSKLINSYCHAWSCTPAWLIRHFEL
ncbi:alpha-L-rhamnosidase-related protein [Erwinia sp. MYb416]|uniref:alpha-L-rhamnosidase-related protein n=1 Tax=Erwinia sp. MYb416 TaxID=3108532 RepID=UPI00403F819C